LTFENQLAISSAIQDFGRLIDMAREQQSQNSTSQVIQMQQSRFPTPRYPQSAANYVTTVPHPMYDQEQNNQCKFISIKKKGRIADFILIFSSTFRKSLLFSWFSTIKTTITISNIWLSSNTTSFLRKC